MELKQITVLLIIIKLLIFSDMCNFFTFIFLIFYLLINSANGLLKENFKELKGIDLRYNKTQKEPKARNIKRLKWLPKEEIPLTAFYSLISFDSLPQNTVERDERGIVNLSEIAEIRGGIVIPREQGNELFSVPI